MACRINIKRLNNVFERSNKAISLTRGIIIRLHGVCKQNFKDYLDLAIKVNLKFTGVS